MDIQIQYSPTFSKQGYNNNYLGNPNIYLLHLNNPKHWDREAWAKSLDKDQMQQNAVSDQGPLCLSFIQHYFRHINC